MSTDKLIVVAMVITSIATVVAMPTHQKPDKMDVVDVLNKTVCPIKIRVDEDADRIPRRIRVMECAENSNKWCTKNHIPPNECCQHEHNNVLMQCVEIQDYVQVYYPKTAETQTARVSVGCMCVMKESTEARQSRPS